MRNVSFIHSFYFYLHSLKEKKIIETIHSHIFRNEKVLRYLVSYRA